MIIPGRCMKLILDDLNNDPYFISSLPRNSINGFLDIGASYGIYSIMTRLLHPNSKIVAIEPFKQTFDALLHNTSGLKISALNVALGNGEPFYLLKERKTPLCNKFLSGSDITGPRDKIDSYTLSSLLDLSDFHGHFMVKMDCEGAEKYIFSDLVSIEAFKSISVFSAEIHYTDYYDADDLLYKIQELVQETHTSLVFKDDETAHVRLIRNDFCNRYNLKGKINEIRQNLGNDFTVIR